MCYNKYRYSVYWANGDTGLLRRNRQWIESLFDRRIMLKSVFIINLEYAKDFHYFCFFYRAFFTSVFY
jgi:hypothetical protein